jgi:hypothetical protein
MTTTYETDYRAWVLAQAVALRQLRPEGLDYARLAEEIESLGRDVEKHAELMRGAACLRCCISLAQE